MKRSRMHGSFHRLTFSAILAISASLMVRAEQRPPPIVALADGTKITYRADSRGNQVPDFSTAGYGGGGVAWPTVPTRIRLAPQVGDQTARVQAAIDQVAQLPADIHGVRGAVELAAGRFELAGRLKISASGVVLRGAGPQENGTVLVAKSPDRHALIRLEPSHKSERENWTNELAVTGFVPVGATVLQLENTNGISVGSRVLVLRPAAQTWIHALGMDVAPGRQQFTWKAAGFMLRTDRVVTAMTEKSITLDAAITTALDPDFGGGRVAVLQTPENLTQVGVENLRCESAFDSSNPLDEQHAWDAVALDGVRDGWVCDVTARHFAGSAVYLGRRTSRVTVMDCSSLAPVSELAGYRRHTFHTDGQQTLFLRCRAEDGRNDFTVGYLSSGPNVFLECSALRSRGFSGSIGSWASGILFDNVTLDGASLELNNRETWNQGVGWAAANSMLWQCSAPVVICRAPPTAMNWADGVWGQFVGDGWWSEVNEFIHPQSLYRSQLSHRLGTGSLAVLQARAKASPQESKDGEERSDHVALASSTPTPIEHTSQVAPLTLKSGVLMLGEIPLAGQELEIAWWRGFLLEGIEPTRPAITRFAPGLQGAIYTDDLDELTDQMKASGQVLLRHHYGLWYDRRRMDHERMRRPDADVWPPFFEQPFARSGQGTAWDGLSCYDLTKYNAWYFSRLREFAQLATKKGLVLVNEMYFQHNILEAGAHWVDSPWRTVNNINGTGFTEPVPFTGDTMKMAAEFYDLSNSTRRELHRAYIRQCLSNLSGVPNVIHTLSAENSGPSSFMEFWLDVVAEWERETGQHPLIALSASKDVQDAILADPKRSAVVDVIDLTYWFQTESGKIFAPNGGTDLAPRQHQRLWKSGRPSAASILKMAQDYRQKFPGKAVITGLPEAGNVQPR